MHVNYIETFGSYHVLNTVRLGYKSQLVTAVLCKAVCRRPVITEAGFEPRSVHV